MAGVGDIDGDQLDDIIVGAWSGANPFNGERPGYARVYRGIDGGVLYTFLGDSDDDYFGWSVAGPGDVNADSVPDLLVGAPFDDDNGTSSGRAKVFSGANGALLHTWDGTAGNDLFGWSVHGAGDQNGDGYQDVIVGAYLYLIEENGGAWIYSGRDGSVLQQVQGEGRGNYLGRSVSGGGDVNRDGVPDFIVGAPGSPAVPDGKALVFSGRDCPSSWSSYGPGWAGTNGVPTFIASEAPVLCRDLELTIGNSSGSLSTGVLFIGSGRDVIPSPWDGWFLVGSPWTLIPLTLPDLGLTLPVSIPCDAGFCGVGIHLQVLQVDSGASQGLSFTRGLELILGY